MEGGDRKSENVVWVEGCGSSEKFVGGVTPNSVFCFAPDQAFGLRLGLGPSQSK